ncbi:AAA family ATPase [Rossellomorea sp. NS-SX7]|uniref:AAA family ATPase n=1 Tax=Rossellomorea sp. NS-SX7 TaxID=3463856 RepID=UPI004059CE9B
MINWFYYSDTNSAPGDLELLLQKRSYELLQFPHWEDLIHRIKDTDHSILFIKANTLHNAYDLCQEMSILFPYLYIILIVPDNMEHTRKAMNVGASDILRYSSDHDEKKEAIDQAVKYLKLREEGISYHLAKNCRVISVCSPKGGIGRTSMVVNLASAFAKMGKKVGVLDANLQFGDVAMHFDQKPGGTIYEWVKEEYERHSYSIDKYLVVHESGVSVMPAPSRPEFFEMISEVHIEKVIEEMKMRFDILLIDTPSYLSEIHLKCLERSEECLLLVSGELPVLKKSKLFIEALESFQLNEKLKIIRTRTAKKKQIDQSKMERILEASIFASLPEQGQMISQSIDLGIPVVLSQPRTPIGKGYLRLADRLGEPQVETQGIKLKEPSRKSKRVKRLVPMKGRV